MYTNLYRQKDFFFGALIGGTLATLTALLFTTKKGKQIQKQISDLYGSAEETVQEGLTDAKDKAEEAGKKIASKIKHE